MGVNVGVVPPTWHLETDPIAETNVALTTSLRSKQPDEKHPYRSNLSSLTTLETNQN